MKNSILLYVGDWMSKYDKLDDKLVEFMLNHDTINYSEIYNAKLPDVKS